jgi:hypothetical protein
VLAAGRIFPYGRRIWGLHMKQLVRAAFVITIGLLATACDKCGNWNINTPQFCHETKPQG